MYARGGHCEKLSTKVPNLMASGSTVDCSRTVSVCRFVWSGVGGGEGVGPIAEFIIHSLARASKRAPVLLIIIVRS